MKKHDVNYHDYDDSISFHVNYCIYFETSEYSFLNQSTKKNFFFEKKLFWSIKNHRKQRNKDFSWKKQIIQRWFWRELNLIKD
jgi:hypothetical protein